MARQLSQMCTSWAHHTQLVELPARYGDQPLQVPVKPDVIHGQLRSLLATLGFPVEGILL